MGALEGWRVRRDDDPVVITITDPDGDVAARVRPAERGNRLVRAVPKLDARLGAITDDAWGSSGRRIPRLYSAALEIPEGEVVEIANGRPRGPRRKMDDVAVVVRGRRYGWHHTSGTTAEVHRDGACIAEAWAGGRRRPAGAEPAGLGFGFDLALRSALDRTDGLMLVVFADLCGPPGRIGAVRRIAEGLWHDAVNP